MKITGLPVDCQSKSPGLTEHALIRTIHRDPPLLLSLPKDRMRRTCMACVLPDGRVSMRRAMATMACLGPSRTTRPVLTTPEGPAGPHGAPGGLHREDPQPVAASLRGRRHPLAALS